MSSKPSPPATLFREGVNCCAVARADRVAVLVDGDAYFSAFVRAAERAQRSILILGWDFNSHTRLSCDGESDRPGELGDFLTSIVQRRRRLRVRVLDWDYPMLFAHERELPPLYGLGWKPPRRVHLRYDGTHPLGGSQHQKIVVIDDALAFVGGMDFTCRRWDTTEHKPDDPRRTAAGHRYPPFHDVMAAVDGPAAGVLAEVAARRWQHATGETLGPLRTVAGDPWPESLAPDLTDVTVGVACTAPASGDRAAVREVEQLYLDSIARAERYLYIENQYFTARGVGLALAERLKAREGPEIVLVTRLLSHGWLEEMTMQVLRTRLIRELRDADRHGRFHVYYPSVQGLSEGTCIDVHSKLMVVDDEWLRIGSANLSNRSMGLDTECDLVVQANGEACKRAAIRALRDRLLSEHLGVSSHAVAHGLEQAGSLHGAIRALHSERRTLEPLVELTQWPDAVVDAVAIADPERPVSLETLVEQLAPSPEGESAAGFEWRKALGAGAVLLGLALAWRSGPLAELASGAQAAEWALALAARWWAAPLLALAYTPASVLMFPRALLTLAAVVAFGPVPGLLCAIAGNLAAALAGYLAGRRLRRDTVRRIAGHKLNQLSGAFKRSGLAGVLAIRLVPLAPFVVGNVVAGAIRVRLWHFALGTFLGMLPGELAMTILGDHLQAAMRDPSRAHFGVAAGVVALLALGAFGVGRWLLTLAQRATAAESRPAPDTPRVRQSGHPADGATSAARRIA